MKNGKLTRTLPVRTDSIELDLVLVSQSPYTNILGLLITVAQ